MISTYLKIILFVLISYSSFGQKQSRTYYDESWKETVAENASFYRDLPFKEKNGYVLIEDYYISGTLQMTGWVKNDQTQSYDGEVKWYYKNGNPKIIRNYKNNYAEGESKKFYENGVLKVLIIFKKGKKEGEFSAYEPDGTLINTMFYKNDMPYDGTLIEKNNKEVRITHYKKGLKILEEIKYDVKNLKEIKSNENTIAKGVFVNGEPYEGTFINAFYNGYIGGEKIRKFLHLRQITTLKNGKEEGKQVFKRLGDEKIYAYYYAKNGIKEGESYAINPEDDSVYILNYKKGAPYNGEFIDKNKEVIIYEKGSVKGIKKRREERGVTFFEIYQNNIKIGVEYSLFEIDGNTKQVGVYKEGKPYNGYFLRSMSKLQFPILDYYSKGVKKYQYSDGIPNSKREGFNDLKMPFKSVYKNGKLFSGAIYTAFTYKNRNAAYLVKILENGKTNGIGLWVYAVNYGNNMVICKTNNGFQIQEMQNPDLKIVVDERFISLVYKDEILDRRKRNSNNLVNKTVGYYLEKGVLKSTSYWFCSKKALDKLYKEPRIKNDFIENFYQKIPVKNTVKLTFSEFDTVYEDVFLNTRDIFDNIAHINYDELGNPNQGFLIKQNNETFSFDYYMKGEVHTSKNMLNESELKMHIKNLAEILNKN